MSSKNSLGDFSLFSLFTAGLACLIPLASAYTKPVGAEPKGNPISEPGLHSIVPAGVPYTVTWKPTTPGTVTLVLLKGPSTNIIPQYAIVEKIPNTGSYIWTPSKDLAPGTTGYGIQLIDDANGQYQYTTQFGISNPDYHSHSSASSTSAHRGHSSSDSWDHSSTWSHHGHSASAMATGSATANSTMTMTSTASVGTISAAHGNGTMVHPTGAMTVPTSLKTTVTAAVSAAASSAVVSAASSASASVASAVPTNGATSMAASFVGLVMAAGVAVLAV